MGWGVQRTLRVFFVYQRQQAIQPRGDLKSALHHHPSGPHLFLRMMFKNYWWLKVQWPFQASSFQLMWWECHHKDVSSLISTCSFLLPPPSPGAIYQLAGLAVCHVLNKWWCQVVITVEPYCEKEFFLSLPNVYTSRKFLNSLMLRFTLTKKKKATKQNLPASHGFFLRKLCKCLVGKLQ